MKVAGRKTREKNIIKNRNSIGRCIRCPKCNPAIKREVFIKNSFSFCDIVSTLVINVRVIVNTWKKGK